MPTLERLKRHCIVLPQGENI